MTWDLGNTLNWEPIERGRTFTASALPLLNPNPARFVPILPKNYLANSRTIAVGVRNPQARPHWRLGVFVSQLLSVTPDSGSNFVATMNTARRIARLGQMNLIEFPEYDRYPYFLVIDIPKWHSEIYLEIWEYTP